MREVQKMQETDNRAIIEAAMCEALAKIIGELPEEVEKLNKTVKEKVNVELNLKIENYEKIKDEKWMVTVSGMDWTGNKKKKVFVIEWQKNLCPACFHLLERKEHRDHDYYLTVMSAKAAVVARELGIFTHSRQIPEVLSR